MDGVFKARFDSAYTMLDKLIGFVQEHKEYMPKVIALVDNIRDSLEAEP